MDVAGGDAVNVRPQEGVSFFRLKKNHKFKNLQNHFNIYFVVKKNLYNEKTAIEVCLHF